MYGIRRSLSAGAAFALLIGALTACGTTTSEVALTETRQPEEVAAMRLADYVVSAGDLDPKLIYGVRPKVLKPGGLTDIHGSKAIMEPIAYKNRLLFGLQDIGCAGCLFEVDPTSNWLTESDSATTMVSTAIMQFPDATSAQRAAAEFYAADLAANRSRYHFYPANEPAHLPKYTDVKAHWRPGSPFLRTFSAHGSYVVSFVVSTPRPELDALISLTEKAYDAQLPLLDRLKPLTEDEMRRLPVDPDNLLAKVVNPDGNTTPSADFHGVLGVRGSLLWSLDRDFAQRRFTAMKADKVAFHSTGLHQNNMVVRTSDDAAAKQVIADRITVTPRLFDAAAPSLVPDSACVENKVRETESTDRRFTCMVAYRRYVGFAESDELADAQQRAVAQYALFANSQ
ncbi:hypothetical protein [Nocardia sp. NPDC052566]|uniref:DUF7373 family lipoprotein n=1 Tax=Nocardia sp. NPDC052566 TaxID=3364330 RepID=UPI0037CB80FC